MPYVSDIRKICRAKIRNNAQSFIKLNRKNDRNISNVKFYSADNVSYDPKNHRSPEFYSNNLRIPRKTFTL